MASTYYNFAGQLVATSAHPKAWLSTTAYGQSLSGSDQAEQLTDSYGGSTLLGGTSDDTFGIIDSNTLIIEGFSGGIDTVVAWCDYTLPANLENLTIGINHGTGQGNGADNLLIANGSNDTLIGGGGNDVFVDGGPGSDTFSVAAGDGNDVVYNFATSGLGHDLLQLNGFGISSFSQLQGDLMQVGSDTQVDLSPTQSVVLRNTSVLSLTAADFGLPLNLTGMNLTFDDDFNSLSLVSAANPAGTWKTNFISGSQTGPNSWASRTLAGNAEQEIYTDPNYTGVQGGLAPVGINPFSVTNGVLDIHAAPTPTADLSALADFRYTSGLLTTQTSFSQTYGYFEVKAELPTGQGVWPGFWLLPTSGQWPPEIDALENIGSNKVYTTVHTDASGSPAAVGFTTDVDNISSAFHTYGVLWTAQTIGFFIDGNEVASTATPADMHQPMYMLMNLAIGGNFPGSAPASFSGADYKIDYVHAYSLPGGTVSLEGGLVTSSGGAEIVSAGGTASGGIIVGGAVETVMLGGVASAAEVLGSIQVGGVSYDATIGSAGTEEVLSGGCSISANVSSGGMEVVSAGGLLSGVFVANGGGAAIQVDGVASNSDVAGVIDVSGATFGTTIDSGATEAVLSGGYSFGATVLSGALETVSAGATVSGVNVAAAGETDIEAGGLANAACVYGLVTVAGAATATTIESGGTQQVLAGGSSLGAFISGGGSESVSASASATSAHVSAGGEMSVLAGGVAIATYDLGTVNVGGSTTGTLVHSGGTEQVLGGGASLATFVFRGGSEIVSAGGAASSAHVNSGGDVAILSGGSASATVVCGLMTVAGTTYGTVVHSRGSEEVLDGGASLNANVYSGAAEIILEGGVANSSIIKAGGSETVLAGATSINPNVNSSTQYAATLCDYGAVDFIGRRKAEGSISGDGVIQKTGVGTLTLAGNLSQFTGEILLEQGSISLANVSQMDEINLVFGSGGGSLKASLADGAAMVSAVNVDNFSAAGDVLDLGRLTYSAGAKLTRSGNDLLLQDGATDVTIGLGGNMASNYFASNDGAGGIKIGVASDPGPIVQASAAFQRSDSIASSADHVGGLGGINTFGSRAGLASPRTQSLFAL